MSNLMKILLVRAEMLHADGRTDGHDEANGPLFAISRTPLKMLKDNNTAAIQTVKESRRGNIFVYVCREYSTSVSGSFDDKQMP
jgi:hypothetical protein